MGDTLCCHQTFFFSNFFCIFSFFVLLTLKLDYSIFFFLKDFCAFVTKNEEVQIPAGFYQVSQNTHLGNFVRSFLFLSSNFLNEEMFPWHIDCFGTFFLLIGTNTITRLVIRISRIRDFLILALFTTCSQSFSVFHVAHRICKLFVILGQKKFFGVWLRSLEGTQNHKQQKLFYQPNTSKRLGL